MSSPSSTPPASPAAFPAVGRAIAVGTTIVSLLMLAFLWPVVTAQPRDLPVAVAGPAERQAAIVDQLTRTSDAMNGGKPLAAIIEVADRAAAERAIREGEVYAAMVAGPDGLTVLTSSAASPAVSQMWQGIAGQAGAQLAAQTAETKGAAAQAAAQAGAEAAATGAAAEVLAQLAERYPELAPRANEAQQKAGAASKRAKTAGEKVAAISMPRVEVVDVIPTAESDARGSGLGMMALPLALGGLVGGAVISLLLVGRRARAAAVLGYAVTAGGAIALITGPWLGILPAAFWAEWAAISLALAATSGLLVALHTLLRLPGLALGAVVTMLIGVPLAGAAIPAEFYLAPWGDVGQWFVPGAGATLTRRLAYFPDAPTLVPWLVLASWAVVSLGVVALARPRPMH